jgi:hypothetical protein
VGTHQAYSTFHLDHPRISFMMLPPCGISKRSKEPWMSCRKQFFFQWR